MNWVFLSIFDDIREFFGNFVSNINASNVSDSSAKEIIKSFFEQNPIRSVDTDAINSDFLSQGLTNLQNVIADFSGGGGSLIASAPILLLAASVVIILGVLGEAFFKKTGIPDIAFLMVLGVIIGPVLGIIQPAAVIEIVPYFAAIALIIIMFDGGYNLHVGNVLKTAHFAVVLVILGFAVSVGIVTGLAHYGLGWEWIDSVLLGSIVGGSSSIIVFGLVRKIRISDEAKSMLSFESALTDILSTIVAFILFEAVLTGTFDVDILGETVGRAVLVGLILGFGVGILYLKIKKCTAQLYANSRCFVFAIFPCNYFRRIRCFDCTSLWFNAGKQAVLFEKVENKASRKYYRQFITQSSYIPR